MTDPSDTAAGAPNTHAIKAGFVRLLSGRIRDLSGDPRQIREIVYELARIKLLEQFTHGDARESRELQEVLERAIREVELSFERSERDALSKAPDSALGVASHPSPPSPPQPVPPSPPVPKPAENRARFCRTAKPARPISAKRHPQLPHSISRHPGRHCRCQRGGYLLAAVEDTIPRIVAVRDAVQAHLHKPRASPHRGCDSIER
ncbi:hypothetical protein ACVWXM_001459 [Bradyrhizobium sp. GM7.3]